VGILASRLDRLRQYGPTRSIWAVSYSSTGFSGTDAAVVACRFGKQPALGQVQVVVLVRSVMSFIFTPLSPNWEESTEDVRTRPDGFSQSLPEQ
jgi:hypothetical protein